MSGANQAYPQTVNLDTAKAKAADMQSQTSKAQGGNINPTDPASKARVGSCDAHTLAIPHVQHACNVQRHTLLGRLWANAILCVGSSILASMRSHRQPVDGAFQVACDFYTCV